MAEQRESSPQIADDEVNVDEVGTSYVPTVPAHIRLGAAINASQAGANGGREEPSRSCTCLQLKYLDLTLFSLLLLIISEMEEVKTEHQNQMAPMVKRSMRQWTRMSLQQ